MSTKIGIICGGFSSEFEISLKSAATIHNHLPDEFEPYLVVLSNEGWYVKDGDQRIDFDAMSFSFNRNGDKIELDAAIVYIHGDPGENGKVQAFLEIIGKPYVNSGPLASELSFDKWYCNQFLRGFGIPVAKSIYLRKGEGSPSSDKVKADLGFPVFVKPCDSGSSYGIAKVNTPDQLEPAIFAAFEEGDSVVIEGFLRGTEVTCGVYNTNSGMVALPPTEIVSHTEFFDYEAKYKGLSDEITPARISDEITQNVQEMAKEIYQLMQLRSVARIDFMIVDNVPHVIEVNTTPGFSAESIVPKMIKVDGKTIAQVWSDILDYELR
ncbi:MAG: D-alanine--D-alanine ligase [Crocinitomicaceae bacterium]